MADLISKNFVIRNGFIRRPGWVGLVTFNREAEEEDVPNGQLFFRVGDEEWLSRTFEWTAIGGATFEKPVSTVAIVGRDGRVLIGTSNGFNEETIEDRGVGPAKRGPLRQVRTIEDVLFTVGMGRQIYRRTELNRWVRMEAGLPDSRPKGKVVGFNAICGSSLSNIYAVGWGGEIWRYNGVEWSSIESPTNLAFFDLVYDGTHRFYACGQAGVLLAGSEGRWQTVEYDGPRLEFRSLAWYRGKLYLADGTSLHSMEGNSLRRVNLEADADVPSNHLHAKDDLLLSTSGLEAFVTGDGESWSRLPV